MRTITHSCLVVEADRIAAASLSRELVLHGLQPHRVASVASALELARHWAFDAIVLDADGLDAAYRILLPRLNAELRAPVLLVSSACDELEQILGLQWGATEVAAKPISARLLATKLRRLIELVDLTRSSEAARIESGPLLMDVRQMLARVGSRELSLTPHEFAVLLALAERANEVLARSAIASALQAPGSAGGRSIDVLISRLRRKLTEQSGDLLEIRSVYGRGYRLVVNARTAASCAALPARL